MAKANVSLSGRDILDLESLSVEEIELVLKTAEEMKKIMKSLNMNEKEYRQTLSQLRNKLNIVEKNLTEKTYENIDFSKVPTKAMLKYTNAYMKRMSNEYSEYKNSVKNGKSKKL